MEISSPLLCFPLIFSIIPQPTPSTFIQMVPNPSPALELLYSILPMLSNFDFHLTPASLQHVFPPFLILCNFHRLKKLIIFHAVCTINQLSRKIHDQLVHLSIIHKLSVFAGYPGFHIYKFLTITPTFKTFLLARWQSLWSSLTTNKLHIKPSISPWSIPFYQIPFLVPYN